MFGVVDVVLSDSITNFVKVFGKLVFRNRTFWYKLEDNVPMTNKLIVRSKLRNVNTMLSNV